tara:strand:+ start:648 stop:1190 length:543 start_codon:yes stop_codon:yes gene_type:complete
VLKSHIRKKIIKLREIKNKKNLQVKTSFFKQILKTKKFKNKIVGSYFPVNFEADTFQIMKMFKQKGFRISLPVISSKFDMNFYFWNLNDPLYVNKYGIPEPNSKLKVAPGILLIPMVAFDNKLNRLGYGGGYYDRFLKKNEQKNILKVGLAITCQQVKKIPANSFDKKMDYIITEKKIFK